MTGDQWFQVLLALLPSVVVFLTAFYLIRGMLQGRAQERNADWNANVNEQIDHAISRE